jgi:hypothetical protein
MGRNYILNFIESKEVFHDEPLTFIGWPHSILLYVPPQGRAESGTKPPFKFSDNKLDVEKR